VAQIVWTAEARRWLQEIYDYIADDNETAAYRTVRGIHERRDPLDLPRNRLPIPRERPEVRVLLYGHYRIAYRMTHERDIEILGVFHAALDVRRYLISPE
jgi:toxin ParE1/3/4